MTFDPFQLIPTSTTPINSLDPVSPPQEYKSIIPQLPSQSVQSPQNTFDYFINKAEQFNNAPLYEYGFKEERRYSNPYLQFNPNPLGGADTEDIYANFQGSGEQLWNSLVKTGATALTSFASSFSSFGDSIDAIRGGKPFDEDSVLGKTQGWLTELEDKYPNYYTEWERDHPYLSALPFSGGFTNFWGDKVLKNVGFTVGSLAASLLVDSGIELATGGTATPATFILAANQIRQALSPLKNAFRSLSKVAALNKVDDLMGVARVGEGINNGLKGMNQAYNIKRGLQFAGTTYFAAQGESMIEGYQQYFQTKADLYKQELDKGTLTLDKIGQIEETAQKVGNITTALNLPVVMASNLLQFPTIFGGKNILKQFDSPFLEVVQKEGLSVVNNYSRKQAWVNTMKELTKDFVTEGGEEGYQHFIGNSVHDYYVDKFNGTAISTLSEYLGKQLPKTIQDEKFWESFVIGGLAGGLMGGIHPIKTNLIGAKDRADKAVQALQPVYERFNSTVKDYVHFAENLELSGDKNAVDQFQAAHKALYSTVHDSLKFGIYDNFQDSLEDLKSLPVEEYNKLFGTEFSEQQKLDQIGSIQRESWKIKSDLTEVNKFFQKNPFDSPYATKRLQDLYKVDQTQAKSIQAKLFEDYKELTAYNISRLRNTRNKIGEIETELKTIGLDESIIPILYNLGTKEGVNQYKRFKAIQLATLRDEVEYYKALGEPITGLDLKTNNLTKFIRQLDSFDRDFKEGDKEKVTNLIYQEELGARQLISEQEFVEKQKELEKQQSIAVNTSEDLEQQTNQPEEKAKEMVETVAKITPEKVEVKPPIANSLNIFNKNFSNLKVGDQFELALSTEEGIFTLETEAPYVASKNGIKYLFRPNEVIKYDNGEQKLRYALDNIGLEVVESALIQKEVPKEQEEEYVQRGFELNSIGLWVHKNTHPKIKELLNGKLGILFKINGGTHAGSIIKSGEGIAGSLGNFNFKTGNKLFLDLVYSEDKTEGDYAETLLHELGHVVYERLTDTDKNIVESNEDRTESALQHQRNREEGGIENTASDAEETFVDYVVEYVAFKLYNIGNINNIPQSILSIIEKNVVLESTSTTTTVVPPVDNKKFKEDYVRTIINPDGTVTLYRGISPGGEKGTGQFYTSSKQVAEFYANRFGEGTVIERKVSFEEAVNRFMGMEGNPGRAYDSDIFSLDALPEQKPISTTKKPVKETISQQVKIKEAADKARVNITSPVKDGIYLVEGDYSNAYRYIDENTVVPLPLKLKGNDLIYDPLLTGGINKSVTQGYLIDDSYIVKEEEEILPDDSNEYTIDDLLKQESEKISQKELEQQEEQVSKPSLTLTDISSLLKNKDQQSKNNLKQFINNQQLTPLLESILEWKIGKGIQIDC